MPDDPLGATFAALAHPTRRAILERLASGPATVADLAAPFEITQPAVSKHLKVLEDAGLVTRATFAQWRPRVLEPGPLRQAAEWLAHGLGVGDESRGQLEAYVKTLQPGENAVGA